MAHALPSSARLPEAQGADALPGLPCGFLNLPEHPAVQRRATSQQRAGVTQGEATGDAVRDGWGGLPHHTQGKL